MRKKCPGVRNWLKIGEFIFGVLATCKTSLEEIETAPSKNTECGPSILSGG